MIRAFRGELVKLRQSTYLFGIAAVIAFMLITLVVSVTDPGPVAGDRGPAGLVLSRDGLEAADGLARSLGNVVTFLGIVVLALVSVNIGGEYRFGTIRSSAVRLPFRGRLLLGKTMALFGYLAVTVVVTVAIAAPAAQLMAGPGVDTERWWGREGVAELMLGTGSLIAASWAWATIGVLLAVLLRSAPAAIGVGIAYILPVEILAVEVAPDAAAWLPGQLIVSLARGGDNAAAQAETLVGVASWATIALVGATLVFKFRDITD
ncbi:hypothetical protein LO763_27905 [Glycomyces sp. A-F 0318]|uniref:hypothetical protein n=1 Tax=Glycomyces amatae TaxID=2881355 RepID=UPI001E392A65|nr:hypothetical protein [Glycomyces amatae]MCD0447445.1 hypothetical protein [Glycomyces amatae]